jgi:hypothetical protein
MFVLASLRYSRSRQTLAAPPSRHIKGANDKQLASGNSEEGNDEEQVMSELKLSKSVPTFRANGSPQLKVERELQKKIPLDFQRNKMALERERQELQAEKNVWAREKQKIMTTNTFDKIVTLNVGGTKYTTSLSTLTKYPDSMLGVMFSGRHALPQQEDGSFFIDRDGDTFSNILSYLRDRSIILSIIPRLSDEVRQRLLHEAMFYQLQELEIILSVMGTYSIVCNYRESGQTTQEVDLDYEVVSSSGKSKKFYHSSYYVDVEINVERANVSISNRTCFRKSVTFVRCNLSNVSFQGCCFEGPVSFEGCLMQGTVFQKVCGLVTQKVRFAPWQVSQAVFDDELLEALEANGCIY